MTTENWKLSAPIDPTVTDLTIPATPTTANLVELGNLAEAAKLFASDAKAPSTRRAYRKDWAQFAAWCLGMGLIDLPAAPEAVASYITSMAGQGRRPATIQRALVSISQAHKMANHISPTTGAVVRETLKGIRRTLGVAQKQKAAALPENIKAMLGASSDDILGIRDRALLLLGFTGGFRRSELVALDVNDIEFTADGIVVTLRRSKTDQEGEGRKIGIPYGSSPVTCPVRSLRRWIEAAGIEDGAIFRRVGRWGHAGDERLDGRAVAAVVQRYAKLIGMDPKKFAGHSLRAGLATAAARAGKSERSIMNQTGHRSVTMVRKYIREGSLFIDNAAAGLL